MSIFTYAKIAAAGVVCAVALSFAIQGGGVPPCPKDKPCHTCHPDSKANCKKCCANRNEHQKCPVNCDKFSK